jgi:CO/xanthine dehydrogenase FAD-binding subunit
MDDFDLVIGRSMEQVLDLLAEQEDARIVAGATDFIPLMRAGRWHARLAIDITRLHQLRYIELRDEGLEIGALTTQADLIRSSLVQQHTPVLAEAAAGVAGPQVQTRATLGGNICTASPAADTVPALMVMNAQMVVTSLKGERRLSAVDFFTGPGRTALQPGEMLKSVLLPFVPQNAGAAFEKVGKRKALIISVVNAAALVIGGQGRIQEARLALGAVAPTVVRCTAAEESLAGKKPDDSLFASAARLVQDSIQPIDDVRASAAYRRVAAEGIARRALVRAWGALSV